MKDGLAYDALVFQNLSTKPTWWYKDIWKINIPAKIIMFMWICLKDCVLTGENYRRRGGVGPSVCTLCQKNEETTLHLFI